MTGLLINGEKYSLDGIGDLPLGDLFFLKTFTAKQGYGVSLKTINEMFDAMKKQTADPKFNPIDLLDDASFLANMIGLVYLVRRSAGERVTPPEVWGTPDAPGVTFQSVEFAGDDDEDEAAAPKESGLEPEPNGS